MCATERQHTAVEYPASVAPALRYAEGQLMAQPQSGTTFVASLAVQRRVAFMGWPDKYWHVKIVYKLPNRKLLMSFPL